MIETENQAEEIKESEKTESEPIKRSFISRPKEDLQSMYEQKSQEKKSGKKLLIIIVVLAALLFGGYFAVRSITQPSPVTTISTPAPTPAPTSQPVLNRSDWSLEILNGSGVTGAARKIADQVQILGYLVVKTGNADKDSYPLSQILVKKELESQVELVVADLKDIIKIASVAGELKEGTASARIIIGKDSI